MHEYIELGPGQGPIEPAVTGTRQPALRAPASDSNLDGRAEAGASGGDSATPSSTFSIDRDTTRPDRVSYSDPFTPTVVPFKRTVVYDTVNRNADLLVRDSTLTTVTTLTQARPSDEHFHASLALDLRAGERTAIPSVAPGAQLVVAYADPRVTLRIGVDSAENWFVEADVTEHVLLTLQVVADRRVFGSAFGDPNWSDLARQLPTLPAEVKQSALDVANALGVDEAIRPRLAVTSLVEHFRRFSPSERKPTGQGLSLYRELALTARGICRHRAYAFMITALGLGIPTRVAMNEAHAWVEVFDGELWHRVDLGGAAERLEMVDEDRPRHVEPRDPFTWPDRSESGLAMAERRAEGSPGDTPPGSDAPAPSEPTDPAAPSGEVPTDPALPTEPPKVPAAAEPLDPTGNADDPELEPPALPPPAEPSVLPPGSVRLDTLASKAERGKGLLVLGQVRNAGQSCSGASVEVVLEQPGSVAIPLGTLVSDVRGEFRGHLVIPWNAALGEHTLSATATGRCQSRRAETR